MKSDDSNTTREPNALEPGAPHGPSCAVGGACACASCGDGTKQGAKREETQPSAGLVIPIFSRRTFNFTALAAVSEFVVIIVRAQPVVGYADAVMQLRVHSATIPALATVELRAQAVSPSCDEPETDFLGEVSGTIALDSATSAPSLHSTTLAPDFGSHLQIALVATKDVGTFIVDLSAELVLRQSSVEPALLRSFTWHAYTAPDASGYFIPFVSNVESATISDSTPSIRMIAQHDGWLDRVLLYATSDPALTSVGLHLNNSATPAASAQALMTDHAGTVFEFGPAARFAGGDLISLKVSPSANPVAVNVHAEWVFRRGT